MSDDNGAETLSATEEERRLFLGRLGKLAVTAPAAALLLSASTKQVLAQSIYGNRSDGGQNPANPDAVAIINRNRTGRW